MPSFRIPGVICQVLNLALPECDDGTTARTAMPPPGTLTGLSDAGIQVAEPEGFVEATYAKNVDSVGNGFCVPLVQVNSKVGTTSTWKAGTAMKLKPDLPAGTVIATFNSEGKYESNARGNHAAFFVEYKTQNGVDGIVIYDQYREWPDKELKAIEAMEANQRKLISTAKTAPAEIAEVSRKLVEARRALEAAYPEVDDKRRRFRRKQPGKRFIGFDKGTVSNNASSYSVVVH